MVNIYSVKSEGKTDYVVTEHEKTLMQYVDGITVRHICALPVNRMYPFSSGRFTSDEIIKKIESYLNWCNMDIEHYMKMAETHKSYSYRRKSQSKADEITKKKIMAEGLEQIIKGET